MHAERVVVAGVVVVVAVAAVVGITDAVWTFWSRLFRHLLLIEAVLVIPSGGCPRAWAAVVRVITPPIILRLGRVLFYCLSSSCPTVAPIFIRE
jgi:hypothetical protein